MATVGPLAVRLGVRRHGWLRFGKPMMKISSPKRPPIVGTILFTLAAVSVAKLSADLCQISGRTTEMGLVQTLVPFESIANETIRRSVTGGGFCDIGF